MWTIVGEDKVVGSENLRPDLVIRKGKETIIFDVTVPFEDGPQAIESARRKKVEKYKNLDHVDHELSIDGSVVVVEAIVVGDLGSWDPVNDRSIRRICSRNYLKMTKNIIVSETIAYSRDVYDEHIRRVSQVSHGRQI